MAMKSRTGLAISKRNNSNMYMRSLLLCIFLITFAHSANGKTIVIVGDSLTEGVGVSKEQAYPALVEKSLVGWTVVSSGVSGSTSASALPRVSWVLKSKPDAILLALGANDGLRGFKTKVTKENLRAAIRKAKNTGVKVLLAGIQMPPNYGKKYTADFQELFLTLAREEKIPVLPSLLDKLCGEPKYNLADGIHPNEEGHKLIAESVIKFLKENL